MRIVCKILLFPFAVLIDLVTWLCVCALSWSAFVFSLASAIIGVLAMAVLISYSVTNGLILLGFAVAVSPMGLPMMATWILGALQNVSLAIKEI